MSRFFGTTGDLVSSALDGFLRSSTVPVARLDVGYPDVHVVIRPDWSRERANRQVALICGGGSGHEPMHVGYVGEGMLTAAVCGGLFASPSADAVFSAITHVAGSAGVLVIVKAYTGDCLNFGLAVERARAAGIAAEMVIFSDDIAIPDHPRPRGLAGVILLYKVCGHCAAQGRSLAEVKAAADAAAPLISTIGVAISSCSTPSADGARRVPPGSAELGLGIHGEPGAGVVDTQDAPALVAAMVKRLRERRKGPVAAMVNNLGGASNLEMAVVCSALLQLKGVNIQLLIGPAAFCTALDMKGFSITFMELRSGVSDALLAPAAVHSWAAPVQVHQALVVPARKAAPRPRAPPSRDALRERALRAVCERLVAAERELNALDAAVGDGDTGTTFAAGARALLAEFPRLPFADAGALLAAIGDVLSRAMGGSAGVLLSILASSAGAAAAAGRPLSSAAGDGLARMMELGGARPGMRTMVDALSPAFAAFARGDGAAAAAAAAEAGALSTASMLCAGAGRSSYLSSDALRSHVDPGAAAAAAALRALSDALCG